MPSAEQVLQSCPVSAGEPDGRVRDVRRALCVPGAAPQRRLRITLPASAAARPASAHPGRGTSPSLAVAAAGAVTTKLALSGVAASQASLPGWLACTVHVPVAIRLAWLPLVVQTAGVKLA